MRIKEISKINKHIKDGLEHWSNVCLMSEADQWAYLLDYDSMDAMHVCYLFQHVCSNIGIKAGVMDLNNAEDFGNRLRQLMIDMTGLDPHKVLGGNESDENGKEQETTSSGDI